MIRDLFRTIKVVMRFGTQHHATLSMIYGEYAKQHERNELVVTGTDAFLLIEPSGSLYKVTRTDYVANVPEHMETWLATYGWSFNGHLAEIGGDRYIAFDPATESVYLDTLTTRGKTTIDHFVKIFKK